MIEALYDLDNLYEAFVQVKKVSGWKEQTQRYEETLLSHLINLQHRLLDKTYLPNKPNQFVLNERGKTRNIESYSIDDRIVQSCFVDKVLLPLCLPKLIYDNSASIKNRGTEFFRKRLILHLKQYAKENGNNGYILLGDFTKFFDNIWHTTFIQTLIEFGADEETVEFTKLLLKQHLVDVSYMSDEEYSNCMNIPFNSLEYSKLDKSLFTGEKYMAKSMGIGSQIAQIAGVSVPYRIDNYCKIVQGIVPYARYMDDFYVISKDKDYLHRLADEIKQMGLERGLILNSKKTQVVNLKHKFTILKTQYVLKPDGQVLQFPDKGTFKRERRKLRKFKDKLQSGEMSKEKIDETYGSWRGSIVKRFGECKSIKSMDTYFNNLFTEVNDG